MCVCVQSSDVFLIEAVRRMKDMGYRLGNLDATIILQKPKVSPHKEAIRRSLCAMLGADVDGGVVNVKAKTHENVCRRLSFSLSLNASLNICRRKNQGSDAIRMNDDDVHATSLPLCVSV